MVAKKKKSRKKNRQSCKGSQPIRDEDIKYEDSARFKAIDYMMRTNKGVSIKSG